MKLVYRVCPPIEDGDLVARFGEQIDNLNCRVKSALLNFERVWKKSSSSQSRYSNGMFPVLYTATSQETALTEKAYWVKRGLFDSISEDIQCKHIVYKVKLSGKYLEFPIEGTDPMIVHPQNYTYCNNLGINAVQNGLTYLVVPSARKTGGICTPVFIETNAELFQEDVTETIYKWSHSSKSIHVFIDANSIPIVFDDVYKMLTS